MITSGALKALELAGTVERLIPGQGWDLDERYSAWRRGPATYTLRDSGNPAGETETVHRTAAEAVICWLKGRWLNKPVEFAGPTCELPPSSK